MTLSESFRSTILMKKHPMLPTTITLPDGQRTCDCDAGHFDQHAQSRGRELGPKSNIVSAFNCRQLCALLIFATQAVKPEVRSLIRMWLCCSSSLTMSCTVWMQDSLLTTIALLARALYTLSRSVSGSLQGNSATNWCVGRFDLQNESSAIALIASCKHQHVVKLQLPPLRLLHTHVPALGLLLSTTPSAAGVDLPVLQGCYATWEEIVDACYLDCEALQIYLSMKSLHNLLAMLDLCSSYRLDLIASHIDLALVCKVREHESDVSLALIVLDCAIKLHREQLSINILHYTCSNKNAVGYLPRLLCPILRLWSLSDV